MDWEKVGNREMNMPPPRQTTETYKEQFRNVVCTEEQRRNIFEDFDDLNSPNNQQIDGWSFVGEAAQQIFKEKESRGVNLVPQSSTKM